MKLNILFLPSDKGGVYHYRVETIAKWLTKLDLARTRILYQDKFGMGDLLWADIIVCQRKYDEQEYLGVLSQSKEMVETIRKQEPGFKKVFVYDIDDFLHGVPKSNPSYPTYRKGSPIFRTFEKWMGESDFLSVSTKTLAANYAFLNHNSQVNPNCVDPEAWETQYDFARPEEYEGKVRIGFAGSNTHYADLALIKEDLKYVLTMHKNATLCVFGVSKRADKHDLRDLLADVPRVEFHEAVETRNYPSKLRSLHIDIGLCPLVDDDFNRSKSAIKFYEYSMAGAATVASKVGEYPEVITEERGILAGKNGWRAAISKLIVDKGLREGLAANAREYVETEKSAPKVVPLWYKSYEEMWDAK